MVSCHTRIVLSNPGTGVFVQQTGRALHEAGLLERFVTTLVDRPNAPWHPWLPAVLDGLLRKRRITEFPVTLVRSHPPRELLRLLTRELDWKSGVLTDAVWKWSEYGFDHWVAAHALDGAEAVYGYEHASLETFRRARAQGMACFYEVPAAEARYAQQIRDRETAAHPELDSPYERRLRRTRGRRQERRRLEWELAGTIIAASEFTKTTYRESGYDVSRVKVIPLGSPPVCSESVIIDRLDRSRAREPLRFLSMGSFALHKGSHHLLEAWRKFNAGKYAQLDVVGTLGLPPGLLRSLPDSVHLCGVVFPTAALNTYRETDVLVFPTLADGFGMVVSEALSQGVPVITTPQAGAAEMIVHGENGLIVPAGDSDALAESLRWCLDHREKLAEMGWRARETAARWQWADYRRALVAEVCGGLKDRPRTEPSPSPRLAPRGTVCLITPAHISGNPRLVKEADTLQSAGYQTYVVAADVADSLRVMDHTILARAKWNYIPVGRGTLLSYAWLTFLQRVSQWLLEKRLGNWARVWLAKAAHHRLTKRLGRVAAAIPADLYHAHNLGALPAAAHAARRNGAKLGFDAEDFHSGELTEEQEGRGSQRARCLLEMAFLPQCNLLTAASPGIADEYQRLYSVTIHPILNVFPIAEAPAKPRVDTSTVKAEDQEPLSLYWFSQTIGAGRGLENTIRAMALMHYPVRLSLRGNPARGYLDEINRLAESEGVADKIEILPSAAPAEMARLAAMYDLGLALEPGITRNNQIALSNKIFVYLLAGIPILLSRTPAQEALSKNLGQAARVIDLDNLVATAQCLDQFANDASARRLARAAAWKLGRERYNWDLEQTQFLNLIHSTIGAPA